MSARRGWRLGLDNHTVDGGLQAFGLSPSPDAGADVVEESPLEVRVQRGEGLTTVRVAGEVDLGTAARLRTILADELAAGPSTLVIDLDQVSFFTSLGLTALALAQRDAQERSIDLRVVATTRATLRPMQITGMIDDLAVYDSYAEAIAGVTAPDPQLRRN
jgi:anti-sigma B factor antagonist